MHMGHAPAQGRVTVKAVLGPTNTGKTHLAIERMLAHRSGMIGLPLRLLAREIYDRIVTVRGTRSVALVTGEEKIVPPSASYYVCTVEAMPLDIPVEFLAIDEVQLAADAHRGHVFTQRILGARGISETMLLGSDTAAPLLRKLLPGLEVERRERLSRLSYAGPRKLHRLSPRTAVVAFSAEDVHDIAVALRRRRGGCAVVMGALSPRTRNAQVAMYQAGEVDFLVATDAIGMGLNMDIDHVAFASTTKFDGKRIRTLTDAEIGQIAGRAGRHLRDGTFGVTDRQYPFEQERIDALEAHDFPPAYWFTWRNGSIDTRNLASLKASLRQPPPQPFLVPVADAVDQATLDALTEQPDLAALAQDRDGVALLWDVCQIPDFVQGSVASHARFLGRVFAYLRGPDERLPTDWVARNTAKLDNQTGDIPVLLDRIARIRSWTYLAHRADWVDDPDHWRERTRDIEDRLSDALHDRLTDQFVDPYGPQHGRRRHDGPAPVGVVRSDEVLLDGTAIGVIQGLSFMPAPDGEIDAVTLRHGRRGEDGARARAVRQALRGAVPARVRAVAEAADADFKLGADGHVRWQGHAVAKLVRGDDILHPKVELVGNLELSPDDRVRIVARIQAWLAAELATRLKPLFDLASASLGGHARGIAFQLAHGLGMVSRASVRAHVDGLATGDRRALRALGVRIGRASLTVTTLRSPLAARTRAMLWCLWAGQDVPNLPARGGRSVPADPAAPAAFYEALGHWLVGRRAVPISNVEWIAGRAGATLRKGVLAPTPELASCADLTLAELRDLLSRLGYRRVQGADGVHFRLHGRRDRPRGNAGKGAKKPPAERNDQANAKNKSNGKPGRKPDAAQSEPVKQVADTRAKPPRRRRKPPAAINPDSPFAVLRDLKRQLERGR